MSDEKGSPTSKGFNDDAENVILSGDPTVTNKPAKGLDSSFNDAKSGDIGDDCKEDDADENVKPSGERGMFNDNAAL